MKKFGFREILQSLGSLPLRTAETKTLVSIITFILHSDKHFQDVSPHSGIC